MVVVFVHPKDLLVLLDALGVAASKVVVVVVVEAVFGTKLVLKKALFDGPVVVVGKAVVVKTVVVPSGVVAKFVVVFGSVGAGVAGKAGVNGAAGVGAGTVPILKVGVTVLATVGEFVGSLEVKKTAAVGIDDGFGVGDDVGVKITVVVLVVFFPS